MTQATPICTECGACCLSPFSGEGYIQVEPREEQRLQRLGLPVFLVLDLPDERIALLGTRSRRDGRRCCVALDGAIGSDCGCRIYASRPTLCREFEAGSPECHQARRAAGLVPTQP